jgi:signal recognition particle receptor subunit beta
MVQFHPAQRELTIKVVYYGPALSGKTTNLQMIHQLLDPQARGRLMSLDTADDRTLFFDLLPIFFHTAGGLSIKIKLYTVPGQVMHHSTRRIVLSGADAIAFIADSQLAEANANAAAWTSMKESMRENGLEAAQTPVVVQFNKRDMPNVRSDAELDDLRARSPEPLFTAVAIRGEGVLETLLGLLRLAFRHIDAQLDLAQRFMLTEDNFIAAIVARVAAEHAQRLGLTPSRAAAAVPGSGGGAR